ncbi:hypothetical protein [Spirillospora sp. CA-294931]|uniref:hypothetical protein n=1 Tax=Spirillospora sp. CA-294931 TaxID=3240042 RepID=UPI003D8B1527
MADNWVKTAVRDLRAWAEARGADVDVQGAELLLELARDEVGLSGPGGLTPDTLGELLLEAFPETVVAEGDEVPAILATVRQVLAFLGETDVLPQGRDAELIAELDRIAPEFADAVEQADSEERRTAAEVISGMMRADGVPLDDQDAVERWVRAFEALPDDERYARTEEYLRRAEEMVVPPVRLAPEAELAAAARDSALTVQAVALAEWVGERPVDDYGQLPVDEAEQALAALALPSPRRVEGPADSQADLPELDRLWWAAADAEVIVTAEGETGPGPALDALRSGDDAAFLAAWLRLFDAAAVPEHDAEDGLDPIELVQNELTGVLIHLYEQERPSSHAVLAATLTDHIAESYDVSDEPGLAAAVRESLALELDDLVRWDVAEADGDGYALTPLGVWAVRELLVADGFSAPVVGDLASAPAAELVAGLTWHRHDTADEEIDGWLDGRDPQVAAAGLLEVMRTGGPGHRNLAAAVLGRVGPGALPVVAEAEDDPLIGPHVTLWLNEHGDGEPEDLGREAYLWLFVDTVAGMLETSEPGDAVAAALTDVPPDAEMAAMVEEMWRAGHPDAAEVLDALGAHHPDKATAKAARTAAYKARSTRRA